MHCVTMGLRRPRLITPISPRVSMGVRRPRLITPISPRVTMGVRRPRLITPISPRQLACDADTSAPREPHRTQEVVPRTHHSTPGRSSISKADAFLVYAQRRSPTAAGCWRKDDMHRRCEMMVRAAG